MYCVCKCLNIVIDVLWLKAQHWYLHHFSCCLSIKEAFFQLFVSLWETYLQWLDSKYTELISMFLQSPSSQACKIHSSVLTHTFWIFVSATSYLLRVFFFPSWLAGMLCREKISEVYLHHFRDIFLLSSFSRKIMFQGIFMKHNLSLPDKAFFGQR